MKLSKWETSLFFTVLLLKHNECNPNDFKLQPCFALLYSLFIEYILFFLYRSCPICQKSCKGRYYYQHIKSHDSSSYSHICKDCGDMFLTKYKLIEHQSLVHTGEASRTFCFVYTLVILALLIYHNMERYLRVGK